MEITVNTKTQDRYLGDAISQKTPMIVYMMNGFQIRCTIKEYDDFTIKIVSDLDEKEQLLYKHAISTISPRGSDLGRDGQGPMATAPGYRQRVPSGTGPSFQGGDTRWK